MVYFSFFFSAVRSHSTFYTLNYWFLDYFCGFTPITRLFLIYYCVILSLVHSFLGQCILGFYSESYCFCTCILYRSLYMLSLSVSSPLSFTCTLLGLNSSSLPRHYLYICRIMDIGAVHEHYFNCSKMVSTFNQTCMKFRSPRFEA